MTVAFYDAEGNEVETGNEDAAGLRKQLAKLGGQLKAATEKLGTYEAKDFLAVKGYDLVEASDLAGVAEDDREERAQALQDQRVGLQRKLLEKALGPMVEDPAALEAMVSDLLGKRSEASEEAQQFGAARQLSETQSQPNPIVDPSKLHDEDAIAHALSGGNRKK